MRCWRESIAEWTGWLLLLVLLGIGIPLYMCMPLWCDATYHDCSAQNIMNGGIHYKDVFETNLPGMVWAHAAVRSILGWSVEAIRAVDLIVWSGSTILLLLWLARLGVSSSGQVWFAVGMAAFYPFTNEFNQVQRDGWMLFPALVALWLRWNQLDRIASAENISRANLAAWSVWEGIWWGIAVWFKPHVMVVAVFTWLVTIPRVGRNSSNANLDRWMDFGGLFTGGMLIALPGIFWLKRTEAWPVFLEISQQWNPNYYRDLWNDLGERLLYQFPFRFGLWSFSHLLAIPLAIWMLYRSAWWRVAVPVKDDAVRMGKGLLAVFYLGWVIQALFLQRGMDYVLTPTIPLALAVLSAQLIPAIYLMVIWSVLTTTMACFVMIVSDEGENAIYKIQRAVPLVYRWILTPHPIANLSRTSLWWGCLREGNTPERSDLLSEYLDGYRDIYCGTNYSQLTDVEQFLREKCHPIKDGQLTCWNDTTHYLYVKLGVRPAIRFIHVGTAYRSFPKKLQQIEEEIRKAQKRGGYVVADLTAYFHFNPPKLDNLNSFFADQFAQERILGNSRALPPHFNAKDGKLFPWNQELLYRSGRYVVFRIAQSVDVIHSAGGGSSPND